MAMTTAWDADLTKFDALYSAYRATRESGPLHEAMQYALAGQGKRIRPLLCMLAAQATGGKADDALLPALALELIHTYSLIHDDLPCMDDDDWRRGRKTVHNEFDEPTALLVGDALLTDAFLMMTPPSAKALQVTALPPEHIALLLHELGEAAGFRGMVAGQVQDLHWTGKPGATREVLDQIHLQKTGALLGAAVACGAIVTGSDESTVAACREFGRQIGLAFQIIDDLLDDQKDIGKTSGKDREAGKLTYATYMNRDEAMQIADRLTKEATDALSAAVAHPDDLIALSAKLLERRS